MPREWLQEDVDNAAAELAVLRAVLEESRLLRTTVCGGRGRASACEGKREERRKRTAERANSATDNAKMGRTTRCRRPPERLIDDLLAARGKH